MITTEGTETLCSPGFESCLSSKLSRKKSSGAVFVHDSFDGERKSPGKR